MIMIGCWSVCSHATNVVLVIFVEPTACQLPSETESGEPASLKASPLGVVIACMLHQGNQTSMSPAFISGKLLTHCFHGVQSATAVLGVFRVWTHRGVRIQQLLVRQERHRESN